MAQLSSLSAPFPADRPLVLSLADARADGGSRRVTLAPAHVTIERSREGIAMRLTLPASAYAGVCVALKPGAGGRTYYQLRLEHRDPDLAVVLAEAFDDRDILADWRGWAAYFGLPTLVERSHGVELFREASWSPSGAGTTTCAPRRRVKRRRAAFVRRHQSQAPAPAAVHRNAEIIART